MTRTLTSLFLLLFAGTAVLSAADLKLPAEIQNKKIVYEMNTGNNNTCKPRIVADSTSVTGKAWKLSTDVKHPVPMRFGLWRLATKKHQIQKFVKQTEIPTDEKFHVYYLGKTKVYPDSRFWFHYSWRITIINPAAVIPAADKDREFDVYVSAKLTGPAYVPGSKSENAVYLERLFFTAD